MLKRNRAGNKLRIRKTKVTSLVMLSLILLCSILIPSAQAERWINCEKDIAKFALKFNTTSTLTTVYSIDRYVEYNTSFRRRDTKQSLCWFWKTRKGDCTEKALLKSTMLNSLGIKTRLVYGLADKYDGSSRHDWFEFKNRTNEWQSIETKHFPDLRKVGDGVWG